MKLQEISNKSIAFVFGRFNPPTAGHGKLLDKLASVNTDYKIFASQKQDAKTNPLAYDRKLTFLSYQFPKHTKSIVLDNNIRTIIDVMKALQKQNYSDVTMVAGSDRVADFNKLLNAYNGKEYQFDSINVVSAGERDPDAEGTAGVSASVARDAAVKGDYNTFRKMIASTNDSFLKMMFDEIRKNMGIKETKEAPSGTYFTKAGNLVKGTLTKAAKAKGARETDPKDNQRSKVPPVTQRNPKEAAGVGIVTKQNATKDVPVGGEYMNVKKLGLDKKRKKK